MLIWRKCEKSNGKILFSRGNCPFLVHPTYWVSKHQIHFLHSFNTYPTSPNNLYCTDAPLPPLRVVKWDDELRRRFEDYEEMSGTDQVSLTNKTFLKNCWIFIKVVHWARILYAEDIKGKHSVEELLLFSKLSVSEDFASSCWTEYLIVYLHLAWCHHLYFLGGRTY